jgi:small subunit ribosomal protein S18
MARNNDRDRGTRRAPKESARRGKKKVCIFCKEQVTWVDYKEIGLLRKFMSDRGKIRARRVSGNCSQHQSDVAMAIKTARELALLPYTQRTTSDRPSPRPGRGERGERGIPTPDGAHTPEADDAATLADLDLDVDEEIDGADELVSVAAEEDE